MRKLQPVICFHGYFDFDKTGKRRLQGSLLFPVKKDNSGKQITLKL
jgi:hypothetical protein